MGSGSGSGSGAGDGDGGGDGVGVGAGDGAGAGGAAGEDPTAVAFCWDCPASSPGESPPDPPQALLLGYAAFPEAELDRAAAILNDLLRSLSPGA